MDSPLIPAYVSNLLSSPTLTPVQHWGTPNPREEEEGRKAVLWGGWAHSPASPAVGRAGLGPRKGGILDEERRQLLLGDVAPAVISRDSPCPPSQATGTGREDTRHTPSKHPLCLEPPLAAAPAGQRQELPLIVTSSGWGQSCPGPHACPHKTGRSSPPFLPFSRVGSWS